MGDDVAPAEWRQELENGGVWRLPNIEALIRDAAVWAGARDALVLEDPERCACGRGGCESSNIVPRDR